MNRERHPEQVRRRIPISTSASSELVQIDGCQHLWFLDHSPRCTLLVLLNDATDQLMPPQLVESGCAFSCGHADQDLSGGLRQKPDHLL